MILPQQNIFRLDAAMQHSLAMEVLHSGDELQKTLHALGMCEFVRIQPLLQVAVTHVLHFDEFEGLRAAWERSFKRAVNLHNVGMAVQRRKIRGFRGELSLCTFAKICQYFDCDIPFQSNVVAKQNCAETT